MVCFALLSSALSKEGGRKESSERRRKEGKRFGLQRKLDRHHGTITSTAHPCLLSFLASLLLYCCFLLCASSSSRDRSLLLYMLLDLCRSLALCLWAAIPIPHRPSVRVRVSILPCLSSVPGQCALSWLSSGSALSNISATSCTTTLRHLSIYRTLWNRFPIRPASSITRSSSRALAII